MLHADSWPVTSASGLGGKNSYQCLSSDFNESKQDGAGASVALPGCA